MANERIYSVDIMRGLVMIIMALDHVRDYFHTYHGDPTDLDVVSPELFMTRWITHFCAPAFVFLAGTSTYFQEYMAGKSKAALSKFLIVRGVWLVLLELTLITFAWFFSWLPFFQVIGAIGVAMIALGLVIRFDFRVILGLGLLIVFGANLIDYVYPYRDPFSIFGGGEPYPLWVVALFRSEFIPLGQGAGFFMGYPILTWCGVMMLGYCFGRVFDMERPLRDALIMKIGLGAVALFIALRTLNMYGDPVPHGGQEGLNAVLSFINTSKYPPSLMFLLMTLGPMLIFLRYAEGLAGKVKDVLMVFGRVPLFYYILHLYLIHLSARLVLIATGGKWSDYFLNGPFTFPEGWGFGLLGVYLVTAIIVTALYPVCKWYDRIKREKKSPWMSYL